MTKELLINACLGYKSGLYSLEELLTTVDEYSESLAAAKPLVIGSADILPLTDAVKSEVKRLWALPTDYNNSPKVRAVKLVMQFARDNGVEIGIKKAKEVIEQHCL